MQHFHHHPRNTAYQSILHGRHTPTLPQLDVYFNADVSHWASIGHGQDVKQILVLSFDDGQGKVARGLSENGFNGKVGGGKWVDGRFGQALKFDGEDDFFEVYDAPELRLPEAGTLMAWAFIKGEKGHPSLPRIIIIKSNTNGGSHGYDFLFDRNAGYSLRFCVGGDCDSHFPLELKTRYHLAAAFDGKKIHIYVNGDEVGKRAQLGDSIDTADLVIHIGNSPNRQRQFQGVLDEIRIFSLALTKGDIVWHMERGSFEVFPVTLNGKVTTT